MDVKMMEVMKICFKGINQRRLNWVISCSKMVEDEDEAMKEYRIHIHVMYKNMDWIYAAQYTIQLRRQGESKTPMPKETTINFSVK